MPSRSSGRGPLPREVQVSKKIAWLLRHGATKENLTLGPNGYIPVADLLSNRNLKSLQVTFPELRAIVQENDKQRFTMIPSSIATGSDDPKDYLIRANQGHSLQVEGEGLLAPITLENMPAMAVHGTTHAAWPLIVQSGGLKRMNRNHVHFAAGLPAAFEKAEGKDGDADAAAPVISGMRNSSKVLMFLDVRKALEAGLELGLSDNGVILSAGNGEGLIPLEVFDRVEDKTGEGVLLAEGRIVKEAPLKWSKSGGKQGR